MPVGHPIYFEGAAIAALNKAGKAWMNKLGFYLVEIEAPNELDHPILQVKCAAMSGNGLRTISPLGKWQGWLFSKEIENAKLYGYKFNIIKGYLFDSKNIFEEYISDLYNIKQSHDKQHPMYLISKLLLNSLYGSCRTGILP